MMVTSSASDAKSGITKPPTEHAEFKIDYIWVALASALFAGFAIGAHLSFVIGFEFPLGAGFASFIQTHGHIQLLGWVGLFIIGISLYFVPRLAGVPMARPQWIDRILWLIAAGLLLRAVSQSVVAYLVDTAAFSYVSWSVAASGLLEWLGILIYLGVLAGIFQRVKRAGIRPAMAQVAPFFLMMLSGWVIYASLNLILLTQMALRHAVVADQAWNELAIQAFIGLVLLPVTFAFSVRMFPLYLRLPALSWPVRGGAYAYLLAFCLHIIPTIPPLQNAYPARALSLSSVGMILKGAVIFYFVWQLDLLTRRRQPWTVHRILQPGPERRSTRPGLPDYGEFGNFERLIYSAYVWLLLAALLEMLAGASVLLGFSFPHSSDVARHAYLLGFATHLIFGVSVRMLPGIMKKKKIASAKLVGATFWLGNVSTAFRVVPLLLPLALFEALPPAVLISQIAFAFSGALGMLAILCLTINLWKTI
jgi:uncharacterized protein involved in response to NO